MTNHTPDDRKTRHACRVFVETTARLSPRMFPGYNAVQPVVDPEIDPRAYMFAALELAASTFDTLASLHDSTSRELVFCTSQQERETLLDVALPKARQFARDILTALQPSAVPVKTAGQAIREVIRPPEPLPPWPEFTQIVFGAKDLIEALHQIVKDCSTIPIA